jgi:hypothetical protein
MTRLARLAAAVFCAVLAGCETTGDPQQGGLFGWSEGKAQGRQARKRSAVAGAEATLNRETERGTALQARGDTAERSLNAAQTRRAQTEERLRAQQARLVAKTVQLEDESPTDATASQARSYRLKVNTISAQKSLSPQQRGERLVPLEAEIDAALARLKR